MTVSDTLRLEMATPDDTPAMADLWFAAFSHNPDIRRMWPDTPGMRKWWADANRGDMLNKPFQRYVKVVDPGSMDAEGRPRVAAYAKWDLSMLEDRGDRYPPWHEDMPVEENDEFFAKEDAERKRVMGILKHYCRLCLLPPEVALSPLTHTRSGYVSDAPRLSAAGCRLHARKVGL